MYSISQRDRVKKRSEYDNWMTDRMPELNEDEASSRIVEEGIEISGEVGV